MCFIFLCQFFEHVIPYTQKSYTIFLVQKGIHFLALKAIVSMAVLALGCSKPLRCLKNVWFWGRRAKHVKNIFSLIKYVNVCIFHLFFSNFFKMLFSCTHKKRYTIFFACFGLSKPLRYLKTLDFGFGRRRTSHRMRVFVYCKYGVCNVYVLFIVPSTHQFFTCDFAKALYIVLHIICTERTYITYLTFFLLLHCVFYSG